MITDKVEKYLTTIAKNSNQVISLFMSQSVSCYYTMALTNKIWV